MKKPKHFAWAFHKVPNDAGAGRMDLSGISSNQLSEYFDELVSFYHEMKEAIPEEVDVGSAA